jgi:hypothetical protein
VLARTRAAVLAATLLGATVLTVGGAFAASHPAAATPHRVLFDNSKAETAGNADWIISTAQPDPTAQNPNPTTETAWTGAISAWGVALQRTGQYSLKTLPAGSTITFGGGGALDLANFDEFVMPEPNAPLSAAEKSAILRFIQGGGGFFLVVDHTGSDRNNDGWDSVRIANDLMSNNGVDNTDPFGFSVDVVNVANDNPVAIHDSTNTVLNGQFGTVTGSIIRNGSTQTLHPADNASVKGLVWRTGANQSGTTGAFFTTSTFGSGRVAVWGDSSAIDDGTGQPGNNLFNGWNDPAGTDAALALNATTWLAGGGGSGGTTVTVTNPGNRTGTVGTATSLQIQASDSGGATLTYAASGLPTGLSVNSSTGLVSGTPTAAGTFAVQVSASDPTGASGSASFSWTISGTGGGGCPPKQLLGNPGFETGTATPWSASSGVLNNSSTEPAHGGSWDAWLDGYGTTHTDTLSQTVSVPAGCASVTLSYWLHVDTAETSTSTAFDQLTVRAGSAILATYSNLDAGTGYRQQTVSVPGVAGTSVTVSFTGVEGARLQTSFVLDDIALTVA